MKTERGSTLIEVLLAIALIGIVSVALFFSLGTASKSLLFTKVRQTARNYAEYVMENVRNDGTTYQVSPSYTFTPPTPGKYDGYTATVAAVAIDPATGQPLTSGDKGIQKITVTIVGGGATYSVSGYKLR